MKTAVISDIHGNLEALLTVMEEVRHESADRVICLGDMVGYGPQPEEVVQLIREKRIRSVYGNHEAALWDRRIYESMNSNARTSIDITRNLISQSTLDWLKKLKRSLNTENALYVHGLPPHSFTKYISNQNDLGLTDAFGSYEQQIAFCGHTHLLGLYSYDGKNVPRMLLREGMFTLNPAQRHIINAGSVGQPRDGDPRAKYILFHENELKIEVRCVKYKISKTASLLRERGFPEYNALRLF